jgi:hypothetical protein
MTNKDVIGTLTHCINWAKEPPEESFCDCVPVEALRIAVDALKQIRAIEGIIDVSNITIQEDVLKYKMIVDVVKGDWCEGKRNDKRRSN